MKIQKQNNLTSFLFEEVHIGFFLSALKTSPTFIKYALFVY